jgi:multicomponent Na+:H+ antiporter subunit E
MLLVNVLLALAWAALVGQFDLPNIAFGFGLGYVMLWLARYRLGNPGYFTKAGVIIRFTWYFIVELVKANWHVFTHVLGITRHPMSPGIVAIPLDLKSDAEIAMLANLITLTPGTLSLDVSADRKTLFVHAIEVGDPEQFKADTKAGFEKAVREVFE